MSTGELRVGQPAVSTLLASLLAAPTAAAELMVGSHPRALAFPHFPTSVHAVVWRNWELVPVARLATVLQTTEADILALAAALGLRTPPVVAPEWLTRGYITIIRANWHLLPYEQMLELLGWDARRLDYALREDDFLWVKLGCLKPAVERVVYRPFTEAECRRTAEIKACVARHFPDLTRPESEPPFGFLHRFANPPPRPSPPPHRPGDFDLRLIYSYSALYGDPLSTPELDPFPDGLLAELADVGVNGVWLQGILYTLYPWAAAPDYSQGWDVRTANLRRLAQRAQRHGIGVYLYLNEPRGMPLAFYGKHPDWKGVELPSLGTATLCTSQPPVLEFLREGTAFLFREVPELAGVFTISMSENPTNCYSKGHTDQCPRCSKRPAPEVVAEVNRAIAEGVHRAKPEARVIAWSWGWADDWAQAVVDRLPVDVELMCTSEEALPTRVGGVPGRVIDYSISQVGPGPKALALWKHARQRGLKTMAKVQLNNTWECSAVPYLPAFSLVEEHLQALRKAHVGGLMLSWTLGGYPSPVLELLNQPAVELITARYGAAAAGTVQAACRRFSTAFREFPFHVGVAYCAPQNVGPRNLLHAQPTGYRATMVGIPYDDLTAWRAIYPEDVFETQFRRLSEQWAEGLALLTGGQVTADAPTWQHAIADLTRVAAAAWCHFRSTYLQIAFVRRRGNADARSRQQIREILTEELHVARTLHDLVVSDSRLGFEATNHYAYTRNDLREKVLNCEHLLREFAAQP